MSLERLYRLGYGFTRIERRAAYEDALENGKQIEKTDLAVAIDFWMVEFPRQDDRTRSGIITTVTSMTHSFRRGLIGELCGHATNLRPEDIFQGAIVILDPWDGKLTELTNTNPYQTTGFADAVLYTV